MLPGLVAVKIEDVQSGDVFWGSEAGGNYPRKGWHVEPEGTLVSKVDEHGDRWVINQFHFLKGRFCPKYLLVEERPSDDLEKAIRGALLIASVSDWKTSDGTMIETYIDVAVKSVLKVLRDASS